MSFSFLLPYRIESKLLRHLVTLKWSQPISSTLFPPNMNQCQIVLLPAKGEENGVDNQNLAWVPSKNGNWDKNLSQIVYLRVDPRRVRYKRKWTRERRKANLKSMSLCWSPLGSLGLNTARAAWGAHRILEIVCWRSISLLTSISHYLMVVPEDLNCLTLLGCTRVKAKHPTWQHWRKLGDTKSVEWKNGTK